MPKNFQKTRFHYLIMAITAIGIVLIIVYIINTFVNNKYKYNSEYNSATAIEQINYQFFQDAGEEFEVGMNKLKYPVFKNVNLAYETLNKKYSNTLNKIKTEFKLDDLSPFNYEDYITYSPMIECETDEEKEEADFISEFATVYKNSFSKIN